MNANANAMKIAELTWNGPPEDPLEYAQPCPHCGELPEWERDGKFSSRYRLNCCGINGNSRGYYKGDEIDSVIAWNDAAELEKEIIKWAQQEEEKALRMAEEDAWADANLPTLA